MSDEESEFRFEPTTNTIHTTSLFGWKAIEPSFSAHQFDHGNTPEYKIAE